MTEMNKDTYLKMLSEVMNLRDSLIVKTYFADGYQADNGSIKHQAISELLEAANDVHNADLEIKKILMKGFSKYE